MNYIEVLQQLHIGKHAWRPPETTWPPKAYIKQHGSQLVLVDHVEKVYHPSEKDKAANDWIVGMHRVQHTMGADIGSVMDGEKSSTVIVDNDTRDVVEHKEWKGW